MSNIIEETVLETHHWTENLFTLKLTRDPGFRFESGQFAMIGLKVDGKPLMRAYSMASASYEEHLEFLSIKVPNGPLTSRLQHVKPGDKILVNRKTTGTLIADNLLPGGKRLYLLSTGTGLAPFLSIIKDPTVYERFDEIILTHTCRHKAELVYQDLITADLLENEFFGDLAREKLTYYPSVTREDFKNKGRITDLIRNGKLFADLKRPAFDKDSDRVMICGNPHMMTEVAEYLDGLGWEQGSNAGPGHYVIEKAFAEK
ncbi:MAG TPA: ferredoxin--NADP reductase [Candidatus Sulfotelmatobacter sp.]|jgi:ferredoxin--NADP+ reductase|nr:ferredoxin--NADP reductase [Candidatus Sulfotelmatobacter sp.]